MTIAARVEIQFIECPLGWNSAQEIFPMKQTAKENLECRRTKCTICNYFFALSWLRRFVFSVCTEFSSSNNAICWDCCDSLIDSISSLVFDSDALHSASCDSSCLRTLSFEDADSSAMISALALSLLFASVS